jgi:prevent-host-death family protein
VSTDAVSHLECYGDGMRVAIRDLRNDTRSVIDAVERGVEVVLTRRGHPIARIVPIEPDGDDLDRWLDEITADPHDSGLFAELERLRREEDDTDDRRLGLT